MNYAANKDAIIQVVTHGVGSPMTSYMSSATPLHVGDKPLYPVDVEKAKALMKEAGFENGFETSVLVLAGNQDEIGIATALQQMWGAIGIKLELQQVDNATRTAAIPGRHLHHACRGLDRRHRRPERDHLVLRLFADHRRAASAAGRARRRTSCSRPRRRRSTPTSAPSNTRRSRRSSTPAGPTVPLYETPYPVALSKKVHGFLQIPLGNNIFRATWLEK